MSAHRTIAAVCGIFAAGLAAFPAASQTPQTPPSSVTVDLSPPPGTPHVEMSISHTLGSIADGSEEAAKSAPYRIPGLTGITANGTTITFTKDIYLRITAEEKDVKITYTHILLSEKDKYLIRLQSSSGNLVYTVFNDSSGKDVLMKVRARDITETHLTNGSPATPAPK